MAPTDVTHKPAYTRNPVHVRQNLFLDDATLALTSAMRNAMPPSLDVPLDSLGTKVLLNMSMKEQVSISDLKDWLKDLNTHVPQTVFEITCEAIINTGAGCAVLITVPIFVWTAIAPNEDIAFVDFVEGGNRLLEA